MMAPRRLLTPGIIVTVGLLAGLLVIVIVVFGPQTHQNLGPPDPGFSRAPVAAIGDTLAFDTPLKDRGAVDEAAHTATPAAGRTLFFENGCATCHGTTGQGATVGPDLTSGVNLADLIDNLRDPSKGMPHYGPEQISDAQAEAIFQFLQSVASGDRQQ